jgi:hypothetical protein
MKIQSIRAKRARQYTPCDDCPGEESPTCCMYEGTGPDLIGKGDGRGSNEEKQFYTIAEVLNCLNITQPQLSSKLLLFNIETRHLPGSKQDYISARDLEQMERSQETGLLHD